MLNFSGMNEKTLLTLAARVMGTDEQTLKASLNKDGGKSIMQNLSPSDRQKLFSAMNNPSVIRCLRDGDYASLGKLLSGLGGK